MFHGLSFSLFCYGALLRVCKMSGTGRGSGTPMTLKERARYRLRASGAWYPINMIRSGPAIVQWMRTGCKGAAPYPIKLLIIKSYLDRYRLGTFIETGTHVGDTLAYFAGKAEECLSIELSDAFYEAACRDFRNAGNVKLVHGDSGRELPAIVAKLAKPALFWLDGHYSGGITACADDVHSPIAAELSAILEHPIKRHVILIDDARCFDGSHGYPHLDVLLQKIRATAEYEAEVSADVIRVVPRQDAGS